VVQRLAARPRGGEEDAQVLADFRLADVLGERLRPQLRLDGDVVVERGAGQDLVIGGQAVLRVSSLAGD
jgi:hypothetical protein